MVLFRRGKRLNWSSDALEIVLALRIHWRLLRRLNTISIQI
jgi:hypothetical protein